MRLLPILAAAVLLGSCTGTPRPKTAPVAPRPAPTVVPSAPRPLAGDWRDWPYTPGDWVYRNTTYGSEAVFGRGDDRSVTISCDNDGRIRLSRPIDPASGGGAFVVRTSTMQRTLAVDRTGHPPAGLAATLMPRDGVLDAMAFSRGRFVIEQSGHPTLVLPAWAEIGRVIEDCRR